MERVIPKVARAICLSENGECRNCDGAIQHFKGVFPDGSVHNREKPCPYGPDAAAAITAFLEAAAEPDENGIRWHMRPDKATEEMDIAGLDDPNADYCDQCMQTGHTRNSGFPSVVYDVMLAAAPEFEWGR